MRHWTSQHLSLAHLPYELVRLLLFCLGLSAASNAIAGDEGVEFPLPVYNDLIVVPVTINGSNHLCAIDSGATTCLFHTSLRKQLGKPLGIVTTIAANGERIQMESFPTPELRIGGIKITLADTADVREAEDQPNTIRHNDRVVCFDMTSIQEDLARDVEGIIGMPLFRESVIQLDFDGLRLKVLPASTPRSDAWGRALDVSFTRSNLPTIDIELPGGIKETCIIDTGYDGTISLESRLFSNLVEKTMIRLGEDTEFAQLAGITRSRTGQLSKVNLGGITTFDRQVDDGGAKSRIGLKYLRQFRVTLDCGRQHIYLKEGKDFNKPDKEPAMGISVSRRDGKYVVDEVASDSPGKRAGIQPKDEVVAVNGVAVSGKPNAEIGWMISEKADAGGHVSLTMQRDGVEREMLMIIDK